MINGGAFFVNANYDYVPTYTAPGHAAIFTGSVPAQNGIVGNSWFDREAGTLRSAVSDSSARLLKAPSDAGAPGAASASPRSLIGTTIGDQLRLSNNFRSKVVAISIKDRSAILSGGKRPNGAFWFDAATGSFVSSDYYFKELPEWVRRFNSSVRPDRYFGVGWERALPESAYDQTISEPGRSQLGARITGGEQKPGPKFYSAFELTPFASEYLAQFAKAAIEGESLGADQYPDLLVISFSTPDLVGHSYGPDSPEVLDIYIRLDRVVADLLDYIDRRVGLANVLIALTSDHGVSPLPELMQSVGIEGKRVSSAEITRAVNEALSSRFGDGRWILSLANDQIYLNRRLMAERNVDLSLAERLAGEAALSVEGVVDFFTRTQIVEGRMPATRLARLVANGFNRARSGDVWLILSPFCFLSEGALGTTHGSPYSYDTHVPIVLFGQWIRAGRYYLECSPSDIAVTLAAILRVEPPPARTGRVLSEAIKE